MLYGMREELNKHLEHHCPRCFLYFYPLPLSLVEDLLLDSKNEIISDISYLTFLPIFRNKGLLPVSNK